MPGGYQQAGGVRGRLPAWTLPIATPIIRTALVNLCSAQGSEVGTVPESKNVMTLSAQYAHFSVGRLREGDSLSLVLPPETVTRLGDACAEARAQTMCMPPVAGMEAIEDLIELMHALFGGYSKVAAADALALRSTETLEQALSEIEQLREELGKP